MVVCNAHPAFAQNLWLEINEARANKRPLSFSKEKEKKDNSQIYSLPYKMQ